MRNALYTALRFPRVRPRLSISVALALVISMLLPPRFALTTRLLVTWDVGILVYLTLALIMFAGATPSRMRTRAVATDEGAGVVLFITVVAAIASIVAIVMELSGVKAAPGPERPFHLALGITTITCSWLFIHTTFAVHYAHEFYLCLKASNKNALEFPTQSEDEEPTYWDFMYFAFVIGMTSQTSDVQITSPTIRRLALLHGVIAFFFNATLLALAVNTAASVL